MEDKTELAKLIGMLHIPISNILTNPLILQKNSQLPAIKKSDHLIWREINEEFQRQSNNIFIPEYKSEFPGVLALSTEISIVNSLVTKLSFISYLEDRVLREIELYQKYGVSFCQIENVGGPYSTRNEIPIIEQCIMEYLVSFIKSKFPSIPLGIQILSYADNVALEIAARHNLEYVRGESFLFTGLRPDTSNQISGTLKKAYLLRGFFCRELERNVYKPHIFVDIKKKHTIFPDNLRDIDIWLDNIRFLKIEGIIFSGKYTGCSIDIDNLKKARVFVEKLKNDTDPIDIPIIAGSGASIENIHEYKKYCDAIIVGSSIKKHVNWENCIDENALKQFMDLYNT